MLKYKEDGLPLLEWEELDETTCRAAVLGGWLVVYYGIGGMTFIPDPNHEW